MLDIFVVVCMWLANLWSLSYMDSKWWYSRNFPHILETRKQCSRSFKEDQKASSVPPVWKLWNPRERVGRCTSHNGIRRSTWIPQPFSNMWTKTVPSSSSACLLSWWEALMGSQPPLSNLLDKVAVRQISYISDPSLKSSSCVPGTTQQVACRLSLFAAFAT